MNPPAKKIYRTWRDELPLWSLYAAIALSIAAVGVFVAPKVFSFLHKLSWKIFAADQYRYLRWIMQGLVVTLRISAVSMVLAMVLGTLVGVGRLSHSRLVRFICIPYIEFFRNTPLLIQLFFWYFGTSSMLDGLAALFSLGHLAPGLWLAGRVTALKVAYNQGQSEIISGIVGLSIYTSAFIAETVRAGMMAIPHGQTEAARSSGLSTWNTLRLVVLPQAFRIVIPPLLSQFLALTKNSAQAMAIGVAEVTYMARQVEANTFKGFEAFTVATALYMVISFLMSWLLNRYDRSISIVELTERKKHLLALRDVPMGYALGHLFTFLAAAGGLWLFVFGARLIVAGDPTAGLGVYTLGFAALLAAAVAAMRPEWGVGFIRGVLALECTGVFFWLMRRLDTGLISFQRPLIELGQPLALALAFSCMTAAAWAYFGRREALFVYGRGEGGR